MPGGLSNIASNLGATGTLAACTGLVAKCAACTSLGALAVTLGTTAATAAPFAAMLVLAEFSKSNAAKKDKAALQTQLRDLHAALHRIHQAQASNEDWRGLLDELLGQRIEAAEQLDPAATLQQLHEAIILQGETITAEMQESFEHTRIYLSKIATDAQRAADNTDEIKATQADQAQTLAEMKSMMQKLLANQPEQSEPDPSINRDLASAVQRLADDAARGVHTAERVLETNDPNAVPTYLKARREKLIEAQAKLNDRISAEAIQIDRELAATAFVTGQIDESTQALERILATAPNDLDAINRLGNIYRLRGDLPASEKQYERLLGLDPRNATRAVALGNLGLIEMTRGHLDAAEDYHKRSLATNKALGRKEGMADNLGNLGLIEMTRGNLDAAEDYIKCSLAIEETLGRKQGMASDLGNLGLIERTRGNLDEAEDYHKRSLTINEAIGRKEGIANQLGNLGGIEVTRGNLDAAEDYHKRSLAINEALGRNEGMANQLGNLGLIERTRGNLDAAEDYHIRSLTIEAALGRKEGMANQVGNLGLIAMRRGNLGSARKQWARARDLFAEIGMPHMVEHTQRLIDNLHQ